MKNPLQYSWLASLQKQSPGGVLRNFARLIGKHLCQSLFFNKIAGLGNATFLKKRLWRRCFRVDFTKFLRTHFSQNTSGRLLPSLYLWIQVILNFRISVFSYPHYWLRMCFNFENKQFFHLGTKKSLRVSSAATKVSQ